MQPMRGPNLTSLHLLAHLDPKRLCVRVMEVYEFAKEKDDASTPKNCNEHKFLSCNTMSAPTYQRGTHRLTQ